MGDILHVLIYNPFMYARLKCIEMLLLSGNNPTSESDMICGHLVMRPPKGIKEPCASALASLNQEVPSVKKGKEGFK